MILITTPRRVTPVSPVRISMLDVSDVLKPICQNKVDIKRAQNANSATISPVELVDSAQAVAAEAASVPAPATAAWMTVSSVLMQAPARSVSQARSPL